LKSSRTWVFDLDNTLHNAGAHIFPHMNRAMTQYLQDYLDLDEAGANALRERYWLRYGATLQGLMRHHGTDPDHFLWHTHQFPALHQMVLRQRGLRAALQRGPQTGIHAMCRPITSTGCWNCSASPTCSKKYSRSNMPATDRNPMLMDLGACSAGCG